MVVLEGHGVVIAGEDVEISFDEAVINKAQVEAGLNSRYFKEWVRGMDLVHRVRVKDIEIQAVIPHPDYQKENSNDEYLVKIKATVVHTHEWNAFCAQMKEEAEKKQKKKEEKKQKEEEEKGRQSLEGVMGPPLSHTPPAPPTQSTPPPPQNEKKEDKEKKVKSVPGICVLRGASAAVLLVLPTQDGEYVVLVQRPRIPAAVSHLPAIPSGYFDEQTDFFHGDDADLIFRRLGIRLSEPETSNLTELTYGDQFPGVFLSAGGSDEYCSIHLYTHAFMNREKLAKWQSKTREINNRTISLHPLSSVWQATSDGRTLSAVALYVRMKALGMVM